MARVGAYLKNKNNVSKNLKEPRVVEITKSSKKVPLRSGFLHGLTRPGSGFVHGLPRFVKLLPSNVPSTVYSDTKGTLNFYRPTEGHSSDVTGPR